MESAVPVPVAAQELGVTSRTLQAWVRDGAPVARKGGRGRGNKTLVVPAAVAAWKRSETAEDAFTVLADEIPEILADATYEAFRNADGQHKRDLAGALAGAWYLMTAALMRRLEAPDAECQPEKIAALLRIFDASRTLQPSRLSGDLREVESPMFLNDESVATLVKTGFFGVEAAMDDEALVNEVSRMVDRLAASVRKQRG